MASSLAVIGAASALGTDSSSAFTNTYNFDKDAARELLNKLKNKKK